MNKRQNKAKMKEKIILIEKALNTKLYKWQRKSLLNRDRELPRDIVRERRNGKTLISCLWLALSDRKVDLRNMWGYSDRYDRKYSDSTYRAMFMEIHFLLMKAGLRVCPLIALDKKPEIKPVVGDRASYMIKGVFSATNLHHGDVYSVDLELRKFVVKTGLFGYDEFRFQDIGKNIKITSKEMWLG